ncbi:MAG: HAD family phosphatase [Acidobacteriaceae bacterium]|nr:HAD family phosphatase [Acidobacteriaceae bacterium]
MALVSSYDGVIFDFGGVLVHYQTDEDHARMAAIAGIPQGIFSELYWASRLDYDRGALTAAEYWQNLSRQARTKALDQDTINRIVEIDNESWMRFDPVMWNWIDDLRGAGTRVAILSNMPPDLGAALRKRTNRLDQFDQVTLSYEVGSAKPEPAIYEHCMEGLDVPPERTLFLDDRLENVRGAELLGIQAMQFLDRDDVLLRLRS